MGTTESVFVEHQPAMRTRLPAKRQNAPVVPVTPFGVQKYAATPAGATPKLPAYQPNYCAALNTRRKPREESSSDDEPEGIAGVQTTSSASAAMELVSPQRLPSTSDTMLQEKTYGPRNAANSGNDHERPRFPVEQAQHNLATSTETQSITCAF